MYLTCSSSIPFGNKDQAAQFNEPAEIPEQTSY